MNLPCPVAFRLRHRRHPQRLTDRPLRRRAPWRQAPYALCTHGSSKGSPRRVQREIVVGSTPDDARHRRRSSSFAFGCSQDQAQRKANSTVVELRSRSIFVGKRFQPLFWRPRKPHLLPA